MHDTAPAIPAAREPAFAPLAASRRLPALDVLRAVALLGIALMNVEFFTRPLQGVALGPDPALQGLDRAVDWAVYTFVRGKFWTLFTLLFGAGFALMLARADARRADPDFHRVYPRRLGVLLLIGLLHAFLLWAGDILVPYAIAGFVLLLLARNMEPRMLLRLGLSLYLAPLAILWAAVVGYRLEAFSGVTDLPSAFTRQHLEQLAESSRAAVAYGQGSFAEATAQRVADSLEQWRRLPVSLPAILGMFLLGAWAVRSGLLSDPVRRRAGWRRMAIVGLGLGLPLVAASSRLSYGQPQFEPTPMLGVGTSLMHVGSLVLCLGWAGLIGLLGEKAAPQRWLAPAGRMALSNYLLQSLLLSTLFYGYGFGAWGTVGRSAQVGLVLLLFVAQVLLCRWWLAKFRQGPVEWVWRVATYGKVAAG